MARGVLERGSMRRGLSAIGFLGVVACDDLSGLASKNDPPATLPDRRTVDSATMPGDAGADAAFTLSIPLDECGSASCPAEAPYVVACIVHGSDAGPAELCIYGNEHSLGFVGTTTCDSDLRAEMRCSGARPADVPTACTGAATVREDSRERCQIDGL